MSSEDPALLFDTPPRPRAASRPSRRIFYVQAPEIPDKEQYRTGMGTDTPDRVDEIIGELEVEGELYYFARYKGGIALKFKAQGFDDDLVAEYTRKQAAGELAPFDPSATYVHPKARVKKNAPSNGSVPPSSEVEEVPDSEEEEEEEDKEDDEYGEDEDSPVKVRRSTRTTRPSRQNLPFSPKKTRSQKIILVDSEEDDEESIDAPRRSTRSRRALKVNLDRAAYYESEQEEDDDDSEAYVSASKPKKPTRVARKKGVRPAYGQVRVVADLDYDPHSDVESAPLRAHRQLCEKCGEEPAHLQLEKAIKRAARGKSRKKRKTSDDDLEESGDEMELITKRGGWVRCLKCPVAVHWNCLAGTQRDEILKAAREVDRAAWRSAQPESELQDQNGQAKANPNEPQKRPGLDPQQTTDFICSACHKGGVCMGCEETALEPDASVKNGPTEPSDTGKDVEMVDASKRSDLKYDAAMALLFRCLVCKRLAHYEHLPSWDDLAEIPEQYQNDWLCDDCASFNDKLDKILAWRPYPANAVEPPRSHYELPNPKTQLPREYLVKWEERSYRRTKWVPHMWLVSTNLPKLKNFLASGPKVELLDEVPDESPTDQHGPAEYQVVIQSRDSSVKPGEAQKAPVRPESGMPDAERRIPPAWKTVDRVLDVYLWQSPSANKKKKAAAKGKRKNNRRIESSAETSDAEDDQLEEQRTAAYDEGVQPSRDFIESLDEWQARSTKHKFTIDQIDQVAWIFVKWDDLTYDEATWDSPPRPEEAGYDEFKTALSRFIESRDVFVKEGTKSVATVNRVKEGYAKWRIEKASELSLGQDPSFQLMDFQVDGFNWLCDNWWNGQHCILADEMGLGKTVQIATFIGKITEDFKASPALIVVPNSTITNWVREFERWAPRLRVVPFYGEAKAREVIKKYELRHGTKKRGFIEAKYHVLVTTYETLLGRDFGTVFKNQPRWEVLVVDEGQRLKSDSSLLFKKLNELNTLHRVIMTGTPLNNNIRELFNLMNFLDPSEWKDLENLSTQHETLTEELVRDLHARLRPYFLRRIKSQVLKLPPKNEVIVPVSMAPLQKEIYRSILSHNLDLLNGLTGPTKANGAPKGKINNILMHLRKCLQHPYLYEETIEPRGLPERETHEKLIDASAKLRFLKMLLPKLKARGHRVLLFSQFVIALDVIEDFLNGEGYRYLRLDGNTKGKDRQKGMDEFNKEGSDVFIYLLTTRAGGVGINLSTANSVIIYDPDFNPHQDLQAIARAYRYGQKNTCLVFKLMVKDSAEERIIQVGKKKLVLDHLIVQKMDDDEDGGDNVESILTYGAQALFEANAEARDIVYTDNDIDNLIEKTEKEAEPEQVAEEGAMSFSFAKIWAAGKDTMEEVVEEPDQGDSWAQTLQKINEEREKTRAQEATLSGRGARRRAAQKQNAYLVDFDSPAKKASSSRGASQEGSAYGGADDDDSVSDSDSDIDAASAVADAINDLEKPRKRKANDPNGPLASSQAQEPCSLCGVRHGSQLGECVMTEKSEHLAEFREMLILHADDEPLEKRLAAVAAIDEVLTQRGHMSLVLGQPLEIVERTTLSSLAPRPDPVASSSRAPQQTNAVASSSKRALSPAPTDDSAQKKSRLSSPQTCVICGRVPYHSADDCPVVLQGPKSVSREIKRLSVLAGTAPTVQILQKILVKQKKAEQAAAESAEVIELSD
ncbi:SNF2 family DNA-dependent ATPase [Roridomyces roridus]|uniref:SNF2 family DNA-dependent ATPase n=1 Tax=Roridomyces roridus TaxID=1738132 RepID=A0AAD7BUD8_9AGAR|nr:SNF2 family DNA-dependent ATPase [Roridomyces roridus]